MKTPPQADWRDALSSLLDSVPPADNTPSTSDSELLSDAGSSPKSVGKLRIDIERKGRGGKTATIISGFDCDDDIIEDIAAKIKKKLATGGSARGGEILIQGERRDDVVKVLKEMGLMK